MQVLGGDPEIQVVGEAKDGLEAIQLTESLKPDLVTMDIFMPNMDGLEATKEIMFRFPTPIILVTSSQRAREVESSLASLGNGALDIIEKPIGPFAPKFQDSSTRLIATVKAMSKVKVIRHWRNPNAAPPLKPADARSSLKSGDFQTSRSVRPKILAIAASTGGPAALQALLSQLPEEFPLPVLIVQHITQGFTEGLASWLGTSSRLEVKVGKQGEALMPGRVYVAPDNLHMGVTELGSISLSSIDAIRGFRPSGTFLFESVARAFGPATLAVILTGMGEDGLTGLHAVRRSGGRIIAQDQSTSVIFGMPGAAVAAGIVDVVLPLGDIAGKIISLVPMT